MSNPPSAESFSAEIQIVVNGEARGVPEGFNLVELLGFLEIPASRVAIERNREIVRKAAWAETRVEAGDQLEIVWFVGGGSGPRGGARIQGLGNSRGHGGDRWHPHRLDP